MKTNIHFWSYLCSLLLRFKTVLDKVVNETRNTHFMFFFVFRAVYEIKLKIQYSGPGHIWQHDACALHAGFLRLKMYTLTICNTSCFTAATMVARTPLNITLYVNCLSCKELLWFMPSPLLGTLDDKNKSRDFVALRVIFYNDNAFNQIYTSVFALPIALKSQSAWN
jgi:hypothetical protein